MIPMTQKRHVPAAEVYPAACRLTHKKSASISPIRHSDDHKKKQKSYGRQVADYNG
jgi:hypothetical protein